VADDDMGQTATDEGARSSLTFDLRGLVWGIESEVAQITSLCRRIDQRVREVNAARAEAARRLLMLDELVDAAEQRDLRAWLETLTAAAALPAVTERFPDRLYTD
jgi:hypothetical protein